MPAFKHLLSTFCVLGAQLESEPARWFLLRGPHHLGREKTINLLRMVKFVEVIKRVSYNLLGKEGRLK